MTDLWAAIAIAMIFEGMMPFLSPKSWRQAILKIVTLPDAKLRTFGLIVMVGGVLLLTFVR
jgi:uncharacterized protein YjeT (DUF2065 family)